ncbi:hypothetical protein [Novosphingobium sp. TH158]|uniref:hypothetical protein n=1 Tax=Novosphingobium sp. TH158 TaxID=2067455 RepID=UPI0011819D62|nr:hypothetical protein [Novosphingobium sp. TH158]
MNFDRLYLVATALGLVNSFMSLERLQAVVNASPAIRAMGAGSGVVLGAIAFGLAIQLLLWFLVAHRASSLARWILVAFTLLALLNLPAALRQLGPGGGLGIMVSLAVESLRLVALTFLFRSDAKAWFAQGRTSQG